MDSLSSVDFLAHHEGRKLKPKQAHQLEQKVPFFQIDTSGGMSVGGFQGHDNADRMLFIAKYFTSQVFPKMESNKMAQGLYNVELHDTYAYLNNGIDYNNCLVWSKRKADHDVVLMPDLYHLVNYGGKLQKDIDILSWNDKKPCIGFWGTTTGDRDPLKNERINVCRWGRDHKDWTDFYITKVAQMEIEHVRKKIPEFDDIFRSPVTASDMFQHKFLLDIPGNTCSWDRVPQILNSQSLLFKYPCQDMCFYYPLLHNGTHYVEVTLEDMIKKALYYENNHKEAQFIIESANKFALTFLNSSVAERYLVKLLETSAHYYSR